MIELEPTKAKKITIPKIVKRFSVAYYTESMGWQNTTQFFTTPESALENFLRFYKDTNYSYSPSFYTIYELTLEVPIIAPSK